jgi:hypothetical protein
MLSEYKSLDPEKHEITGLFKIDRWQIVPTIMVL